jgi:hypothetical protein
MSSSSSSEREGKAQSMSSIRRMEFLGRDEAAFWRKESSTLLVDGLVGEKRQGGWERNVQSGGKGKGVDFEAEFTCLDRDVSIHAVVVLQDDLDVRERRSWTLQTKIETHQHAFT